MSPALLGFILGALVTAAVGLVLGLALGLFSTPRRLRPPGPIYGSGFHDAQPPVARTRLLIKERNFDI